MNQDYSNYLRFLKGDAAGLEALVETYNKTLIFFLNTYVHDLTVAEDLAAETFFELVVKKSRFKPNFSFKTWLFRIGRNNAIDYLRKQKRRNHVAFHEIEETLDHTQNLDEHIIQDERKNQLLCAMSHIAEQYRDILYLIYFEDMSYVDAGIVMKKSEKQIKNLVYRAKLALKQALEMEGFCYENY
ncbi:MAG: RNA polymerase sigma factor [bacterium]|nr:RNA polymerase sigma factor [bacterium]